MKTAKLFVVLVSFLLVACVGTPFRWDTARQIKVGMTKEQVVEIMGKPLTISAGTGDQEFWAWNYGTGLGTGGYFRVVIKSGKVVEVPKIPDSL